MSTPSPFAAPTETAVSLIGLGPMGNALARALLRNGTRITVFNRSPAKVNLLASEGAVAGTSVVSTLTASPVSIVCLADYAAARQLLAPGASEAVLAGRTIIHLSTGTPKEAREMQAWIESFGARYLDGAILVTPSQIGTDEAAILVGGKKDVFQSVEPLLKTFAPVIDHVGEEVGAAAALDLAFLSYFFGGLLGFYHGARIMETENLPVTMLGGMIGQVAGALGKIVEHDGARIARNDLDQPESSLQNSATVMELILKHAIERQFDPRFPQFGATWFRAGIAAGFSTRDTAALIELLREPAS